MKILILDDTITWADLVKIWLKKLNIEYDYAENGFEAISYLQQNTYDFMVTDISMPEMSGFKLVDYVRNHFDIIIAVMSNHDEYIRLIANVDHKFLKPNSFEHFKEIINIIASGRCKLINSGECSLVKYGQCKLITEKHCVLNNYEPVEGSNQ